MKKAIVIPVMAIFAMGSTAMAEKEFSFDKKLKFDGITVASISVDMPSGDIKIVKSAGSEIEVEFKNVVFADNEAEAGDLDKKCEYDAKLRGDALDIRVDLPRRWHNRDFLDRLFSGNWDNNLNLFLKIGIPDGKTVEIRSSSADIEAAGAKLDLDIRSSSSDVELKDTEGNLSCNLSSGDVDIFRHKGDLTIDGKSSDVRIDGVAGNVDVHTSSGDGRFDDIGGTVAVSASSGDYRIYNIGGDLDIRTSSGDLYVDGAAGSLRAESSSGDIRLCALSAVEGDFEIGSVSGDVTVEINPDFSGRLLLKSASGNINSRISADLESLSDSRLAGMVGDGKGRLNVSTSSGDIRITRY